MRHHISDDEFAEYLADIKQMFVDTLYMFDWRGLWV